MTVARGPKDAKAVGSIRLTIGQFDDGEKFVVQYNWKISKDTHTHIEGCEGRGLEARYF